MKRRFLFILDVIAGALGWIGFGLMWFIAFYRGTPFVVGHLRMALLFVAVVVFGNLIWVRYNVGRSQRFAGRRGPRIPPSRVYTHDAAGRPIQGDTVRLRAARVVEIDLVRGDDGLQRKRYRMGSARRKRIEVRSCSNS